MKTLFSFNADFDENDEDEEAENAENSENEDDPAEEDNEF